ncbi:hypothetical protein [Dietzia sp. ANT_WB102]|uniref:hypothetical protein n=1 Tax=Dietzia sp. ANT_WB102 TaxID=2597345 RepID=UPI00351A993D
MTTKSSTTLRPSAMCSARRATARTAAAHVETRAHQDARRQCPRREFHEFDELAGGGNPLPQRIRELAERLVPTRGANCPVAVVANTSRPHRVELRGALGGIADAVESAGLRQAAVILVGHALDRPGSAESWLYASDPERESTRRRPEV